MHIGKGTKTRFLQEVYHVNERTQPREWGVHPLHTYNLECGCRLDSKMNKHRFRLSGRLARSTPTYCHNDASMQPPTVIGTILDVRQQQEPAISSSTPAKANDNIPLMPPRTTREERGSNDNYNITASNTSDQGRRKREQHRHHPEKEKLQEFDSVRCAFNE